MTTHNTGNPVPSTAVKDLYDNAENLDIAMNTDYLAWPDRLGKWRPTFAGLEKRVNDMLAGMGLSYAGVYAPGLVISSHSQWIEVETGDAWVLSASVPVPYAVTGDWATDKVNFKPVPDLSLRGELLADDGAGSIGYGSSTVKQQLDEINSEAGSEKIQYNLNKTQTFKRTVGQALRDNPNILDYLDSAERADAQTGNPEFDASAAFNRAILDGGQVNIAPGVYGIADTVRARYDTALIGPETGRGTPWGKGATLKWIGGVEPRKAMFLAGANDVGANPTEEMAAVTAKNFYLDGDNKVGFLLYSTYLSNESVIKHIKGKGSTEYNFYFAKAWYATIEDITSYAAKNNGIAIGMPLRYADNTVGSSGWGTLEVNTCNISKLRSHSSGQRFSVDAPNTWTPYNEAIRRHGYGLGIGVGHGLYVKDFVSERSGGANLYSITDFKPNKSIYDGYLELPCINAGLPRTDWANIILEATSTTGGEYALTDIHLNESSGGIFTCGQPRSVLMERVQGGEFLKSLEANGNTLRSEYFPPRFVSLDNCDTRMGFYSVRGATHKAYSVGLDMATDWVVEVERQAFVNAGNYLVWIKPNTGWTGSGNALSVYWDGAEGNIPLSADLPINQWTLVAATNVNLRRVRRGASTGSGTFEIAIQLAKPNSRPRL